MRIMLFVAAIAMLMAACTQNPLDKLTGAYVNHSQGDYSIADDTLQLVAISEGQFDVVRRTGFNLIREGRLGKREHETEKWKVEYDPKAGILLETMRGKRIAVDMESQTLTIGDRVYQKIKD